MPKQTVFNVALLLSFFLWQSTFNPYSPASDKQVPMWDDVDNRWEWKDVSASRTVQAVAGVRRDALRIACGATACPEGAAFYQGYGNQSTTDLGTKSAVLPDASNPPTTRHTSAAVAGSDIGTQSDFLTLRTGRNIRMQDWVRLSSITSQRIWICLTDQSLATHANSDNPAGNYACFRFSTDVPETTWKCVTKDNTTQNVVNSAITVDTNGHRFEIFENSSAGQYSFWIDNALVCAISSNIPTTSTNLKFVAGGEARAASAKDIDVGWVYTESDK